MRTPFSWQVRNIPSPNDNSVRVCIVHTARGVGTLREGRGPSSCRPFCPCPVTCIHPCGLPPNGRRFPRFPKRLQRKKALNRELARPKRPTCATRVALSVEDTRCPSFYFCPYDCRSRRNCACSSFCYRRRKKRGVAPTIGDGRTRDRPRSTARS